MTSVVSYTRPKYIFEASFPEEHVGDLSKRFSIFELAFKPKRSQLLDRNEIFFPFFQLLRKNIYVDLIILQHFLNFLRVFLDECNDCLSEIFRYIFRIIYCEFLLLWNNWYFLLLHVFYFHHLLMVFLLLNDLLIQLFLVLCIVVFLKKKLIQT